MAVMTWGTVHMQVLLSMIQFVDTLQQNVFHHTTFIGSHSMKKQGEPALLPMRNFCTIIILELYFHVQIS